MKKHALASTFFAILTVLSGCGGGSSEAANVAAQRADVEPVNVQVTGMAGPGVIRNGRLTAYKVDDSGQRSGEPLITTNTNTNGAFVLALGPVEPGSLVELEVSGAGVDTTMNCGAVLCGPKTEALPLTPDFALSSVVVVPEGGEQLKASLTPWSAMAVARARALQKRDANLAFEDAYLRASAEVGQIVGIDVADTHLVMPDAPGSTDSAPAQYAIVSAAVVDMLSSSEGSSGFSADVQTFIESLSDGVFGSPADGFTAADFAAAVRRAVDGLPELSPDVLETLANLTARLDLVGEEGFTPGYEQSLALATDASREDKIAAFQMFMSQIRTWLSSLAELETDELQQVSGIDIQTVQSLVDQDVQSQFQFIGDLVDQVLAFVINNPHRVQTCLAQGEMHPLEISNNQGRPVGLVHLRFVNDQGLRIRISGAMTGEGNSTYRPIDFTLSTGLPVEALPTVAQNVQTDPTAFANVLASHQLTLQGYMEDGQGVRTLAVHDLLIAHQLNPAMTVGETGAVDVTNVFRSAALEGAVTVRRKGAVFSGNAEQWVIRLGAATQAADYRFEQPLFSERWRLSGEFVSPDKTKRFTASAEVRAKSSTAFDTFSWLEYGNDNRYINGSFRNVNQLFSLASAHVEQMLLPAVNLSASFGSGSSPVGRLEFTGYSATPQSHEAYRTCLDNAGEALQEDQTLVTSLPPHNVCAATHLQPVHHEVPLTYVLLNQLESDIREHVVASYDLSPATGKLLTISEVHGYVDLDGHVNSYTASIGFSDPSITDDFQDVAFTVAALARLPDMRVAQVAVSARGAEEQQGHLRADVVWDRGGYTAVFDVDNLKQPEKLSARLFNAQGYALSLDVSRTMEDELQLSGEASIDGEVVGYLELRERNLPVIVYPNGDEQVIESIY